MNERCDCCKEPVGVAHHVPEGYASRGPVVLVDMSVGGVSPSEREIARREKNGECVKCGRKPLPPASDWSKYVRRAS